MTDNQLRRVSVNLTPRAQEALTVALALTTEGITETVNKAVRHYAETLQVQQEGGRVVYVDAQGKAARVRFL